MGAGWVHTAIGEIVSQKGLQIGPFGSQLKASEYTNDSDGVPVVMPKDILAGKIIPDKIARTTIEKADRLSKHLLKEGDILFPRRGDLSRIGLVSKSEEGWLCGTGCLRARIGKNADPSFLSIYLTQKSILEWLETNAVGQTMLNLNTQIISNLPVHLPTLPEQHKIAEILSTWDRAIDLTETMLTTARTRKRGLMQILLTGKRRFSEFEGQAWREVRLGEVVSLSKERLDPRKEHEACCCIELEHIESKTGRLLGSAQSNQQASIKAIFNPGDVLFGKLRPYLRKFIAPDFKGVCSTEIWVLQPKAQEITSRFLHCLIQSDGLMAEAEKSSGSRMPRADWKIVSEYCFSLPKLNEQSRIASTLDLCSQEVNALTNKIERLHTEKKALMRKLLTGEWRVKVEDPLV